MLSLPQLFADYSLEATTKDHDELAIVAPHLKSCKLISIPFLPKDDHSQRIKMAEQVQRLGFRASPHFSARRLKSSEDFTHLLSGLRGITSCLVIAGDPALPEGPFADSLSLIETGAFEAAGITQLGVAGHPEGHPNMTADQCMNVIKHKCSAIERRGMKPVIITQFAFDAEGVLRWLQRLREVGLHHPVRLGVAGPTSIKNLMRFAALCGVQSSASVIAKYGFSLGNLLGKAGPEKFLLQLANGMSPAHGAIHLHFYPFGGLANTVNWIDAQIANHGRA